MTDRIEHRVSAWVGSFGDPEALEAYLTPTYSEDGDREEAPFERDFGIRINPEGREAEFTGSLAAQNAADAVRGFSYVEQFRSDLERSLASTEAAGCDSLFLAYDYEGETQARRSDRMVLLGTYPYDPSV